MTEQIENQPSQVKWYQTILFKLGIITAIVLVLLIPSSWIQSLIDERAATQQAVTQTVSDQWSGSQLIQGPVLVIPYKKQLTEVNDKKQNVTREVTEYAYVLPEDLGIKATVKTELFHRGIIDVTGYTSKIAVQGSFNQAAITKLGVDPSQVVYDKVRMVFSLSDLKGLINNPTVKINDQNYAPEPIYGNNSPYEKGLQVTFAMPKGDNLNFSYNLDLKGSNELNFFHIGKTTDVEVSSDWKSPGFDGKYLPNSRNISANGFTAKWHMLYYNRPFPQQWLNDDSLLTGKKAKDEAVFGVRLQLPIDQYRETTRTAKYAILIILLTFVSLFLTELIRKQRIHVFNYILIGAAMIVYYTLLLSFSEHMGFSIAYLIASASTIALISWFTASLLNNKNMAVLFGSILGTFYGFIYVLVQLEELSLLVGSIALFIIVAVLMYFSRKINWDKH
ncbi:cell envelope integrity protein CreD [Mucilaginibacter sp. AW1-3]